MIDASDPSNVDLLAGSAEVVPQGMPAVPQPTLDADGGAGGGSIKARGTERDRMVRQLRILTDRLTFSLRNNVDPRLTPQQRIDLCEAAEAECAAAEQDEQETSLYLAQVSHDIRTRMTCILGYADLLLDTALTEGQSRKVHSLKEASLSLLSIINSLLDISALQAGQLELACGAVNLPAIVENVRLIGSHQAAAKGLYLRTEIGHDVPEWINADATRLSQVLLDLVIDGLTFTLHGGVLISITAERATASDMVRFDVIDTEAGIPLDRPETLVPLFNRSRYSYDRPSDGTGLSLSFSKRLVEAMGGTIGVERPPRGGCVYWFKLPLLRAAPPVASPPPETTASPHTRNGRILVAEDLPMNQTIIKEILEADGHHVTTARDGIAVINAMNKEPFDLVLMDVAMPTMGGLETAQAIRALDGKLGAVPVLALTAHSMPWQVAACRAAGMDDYLAKPIDRKLLLETVNRWLAQRPAQARGLDVLIVDDVPMNRDIAGSFVRAAGHNVTCADGGEEAVAMAAKTDFDVVLMDVRMPEMDGLEATRRIRRLEGKRARVPIVAVTAHAFAEQVTECREAGMDDYVFKPFDQETLVAAVVRASAAGAAPGGSTTLDRTATSVPVLAAVPLTGSELPVRDATAFERATAFLAPDTIETYLRTIAERGEALLRGLRGSDVPGHTGDQLTEAAHALAGSAGMFGFARLADMGRRFEWAVSSGAADTAALAEGLEAATEATMKAIRDNRRDWVGAATRKAVGAVVATPA